MKMAEIFQMGRKHCGKRRNWVKPHFSTISLFSQSRSGPDRKKYCGIKLQWLDPNSIMKTTWVFPWSVKYDCFANNLMRKLPTTPAHYLTHYHRMTIDALEENAF